jgi:hypothetical protein
LEGIMSDVSHRDPSGAQSRAARSHDSNRRRFLMLSAGAAGATAAAPLLAAPAAMVETAKAAPKSQGYQETDHVRNYYATTRI